MRDAGDSEGTVRPFNRVAEMLKPGGEVLAELSCQVDAAFHHGLGLESKPRFALLIIGGVREYDMSMQLGIEKTTGVVVKDGGDDVSGGSASIRGGFDSLAFAHGSVTFERLTRRGNGFLECFPYTIILPYNRQDTHGLWCRDGDVVKCILLSVSGGQLVSSRRVAIGAESLELRLANLSFEIEPICSFSPPFALNLLALGVVVVGREVLAKICGAVGNLGDRNHPLWNAPNLGS